MIFKNRLEYYSDFKTYMIHTDINKRTTLQQSNYVNINTDSHMREYTHKLVFRHAKKKKKKVMRLFNLFMKNAYLPFRYFVLCLPYPAHCSSAPEPTRTILAFDLYLTRSLHWRFSSQLLLFPSYTQPLPLAASHKAIPIFRSCNIK